MAASARPAITGHGLGYDSSALICVTCTSTIVNTLLAGALKAVTDKLLQRQDVLPLVWASGTHTYVRGLSRLLYSKLHWLDLPERVVYKLDVVMYGQAPQYLMDSCLSAGCPLFFNTDFP